MNKEVLNSSVDNLTQEQFALMIIKSAEKNSTMKDKGKLKLLADRIAAKFEEYKEKAIHFLEDAEALEEFLLKVDEKLKHLPNGGDKLAYIPEMILLVRSYAIKEYEDISLAQIIAIVAALIYFVSPIDVIPDSIPFAGVLDDVAVAGIVVGWCNEDIDKYMQWLKNKE